MVFLTALRCKAATWVQRRREGVVRQQRGLTRTSGLWRGESMNSGWTSMTRREARAVGESALRDFRETAKRNFKILTYSVVARNENKSETNKIARP